MTLPFAVEPIGPAVRADPVRLLKLRLHPAGHLFFEKEQT